MIILNRCNYESKPRKNEMEKVFARVSKELRTLKPREISMKELASAVEEGKIFIPFQLVTNEKGYYIGRKKEYFVSTRYIALDIDHNYTIEEALKKCKELELEISLLYPTYRHTNEDNRFRIIFRVDEITTKEGYSIAWNLLNKAFGNKIDKQAKDHGSRAFLGTNKKAIIVDDNAYVCLADLSKKLGFDDIVFIDELNDNNINNYLIDDFLAYKKNKVTTNKTKKLSPKEQKERTKYLEEIKSKFNKKINKLKYMKEFEAGRWQGHEITRSLKFVYKSIGQAEVFWATLSAKYSDKLQAWQSQDNWDKRNNCNGHTFTNVFLKQLLYINSNKQNYSNYKANKIFKVNRYLEENEKGVLTAIEKATNGFKALFVAETGSGKTYSKLKILKSLKQKCIYLVPNMANAQQIGLEYGVGSAYDKVNAQSELKKHDIVCMTWDKISQILNEDLSNHLIIFDEIQQVYKESFREKAIKNIVKLLEKEVKGIIDITATPKRMDFKEYDYIIKYDVSEKTNYIIDSYDKIENSKIKSIIDNSKKCLLLQNNKLKLQYFHDTTDKKTIILNADRKNTKEYETLVQKQSIEDAEMLVTTTVITAGVNIKDNDITDIIVVGFKDPATIKQFVARARGLKKCNVHIFNNYVDDEKSYIYNIEFIIKKTEEKYIKIIENLNITAQLYKDMEAINVDNIIRAYDKSDDAFFYDEDEKIFKINKIAIRNRIYDMYYNNQSFSNFNELIGEYFENINEIKVTDSDKETKEIKKIKTYFKDKKELKKEILTKLSKKKKMLLGASMVINNNLEPKLKNLIESSGTNIEEVRKNVEKLINIKEAQECGVDKILKINDNIYFNYKFSPDLSWKLANLSNMKRKLFFNKINFVIFRYYYDNHRDKINMNLPENKLYQYIIDNFQIGTIYNKEGLKQLSEELKKEIGDLLDFTISNLMMLLSSIFNVEIRVNNILATKNCNYYKENILKKNVAKKDRKYVITGLQSLERISKELSLEASDKSLSNFFDSIIMHKTLKFEQIDKEISLIPKDYL